MTRTVNMNRRRQLELAEKMAEWNGNTGAFLVQHPTWTFNKFTKYAESLRSDLHSAFGFGGYLAGQKPEGHDDVRNVSMNTEAWALYLEIEADEA